jgi:sarcosine oxidase
MYDIIVIGLGSMGSSALYQLSKAGLNVLGLEQFNIVHTKGSHSGGPRIIRKAYFEHPDYVPLLEDAYKGWMDLEKELGVQVYYKTGLKYIGKQSHPVMKGVKKSSQMFNIPVLDCSKDNYEPFHLQEPMQSMFEPNAGFVSADLAIQSFIELSKKYGATIKTCERVLSIEQKSDFISVRSDANNYKAKKIICTAGSYISELIENTPFELTVTRQLISWIEPSKRSKFEFGEFPCWMIVDEAYEGVFYGFPINPNQPQNNGILLKVAHHAMGEKITPFNLQDYNSEMEKKKIKHILNTYIPDLGSEIKSVTACMYTNSVDEQFIIDFLPNSDQKILVATGFSGQGFKFVPVIGRILKDLAIECITNKAIEFLSVKRFMKQVEN